MFVWWELRTRHPLVRLGILRSAPLRRANLGLVILFGSYVGFQFVAMQFFQNTLGWSALATSLAFLPAGLLVALFSTRVGSLADRHGTPKIILGGAVSLVAAYLIFLNVASNPTLWLIIPGMLLLGGAFALAFPSLNIQGTNGVADAEQGLASGLINTSGQVGGAVVLAVVTATLTSSGSVQAAIVVSAVFALIGLGIAITGVVGARAAARSAEPVLEAV